MFGYKLSKIHDRSDETHDKEIKIKIHLHTVALLKQIGKYNEKREIIRMVCVCVYATL